MNPRPRHFLTLLDLSPDELRGLIRRASNLKQAHQSDSLQQPLGTVLARCHRALKKLRTILGDSIEPMK